MCDEYFVDEAAKLLRCSYLELNDHPQKFQLMSTAFTLREGHTVAENIIKIDAESKAKLNGNA